MLATVNISKMFSNGNAPSVVLPERVAKNINIITWLCLVCTLCKFVLLVLPHAKTKTSLLRSTEIVSVFIMMTGCLPLRKHLKRSRN